MKKAIILLFVIVNCFAQTQLQFRTPPPPGVTTGGTTIVGNNGLGTFCYWIVTTYPAGTVLPQLPNCAYNVPNILDSSNYVKISWSPASGATNYTVIRTTSKILPSNGTCTSCVVVANTTSTTVNDNGSSLGNYTSSVSSIPPVDSIWNVDNINYSTPRSFITPGIDSSSIIGGGVNSWIDNGTTVSTTRNVSTTGTFSASSTSPSGFSFDIGTNAPSGIFAGINSRRAISGSSLFFDMFHDENTFNSATTGGYASFDSDPMIIGSTHYNHFVSFQSRAVYAASGTIDAFNGFDFDPVVSSGVVASMYGFHVYNPTGSGTINSFTAFYCDPITATIASKYCLYQQGTEPNYLGGSLQLGGALIANGGLSGNTLAADASQHSARLGTGTSTGSGNFYIALFGANAGAGLTSGANFTTLVGSDAGAGGLTSQTNNTIIGSWAGYFYTGSHGVLIGDHAGYQETGSNKLFIDNLQRADEANGRSKSLIYGVFDAATANQVLSFNAATINMAYLPTTCSGKPTGSLAALAGVINVCP